MDVVFVVVFVEFVLAVVVVAAAVVEAGALEEDAGALVTGAELDPVPGMERVTPAAAHSDTAPLRAATTVN